MHRWRDDAVGLHQHHEAMGERTNYTVMMMESEYTEEKALLSVTTTSVRISFCVVQE